MRYPGDVPSLGLYLNLPEFFIEMVLAAFTGGAQPNPAYSFRVVSFKSAERRVLLVSLSSRQKMGGPQGRTHPDGGRGSPEYLPQTQTPNPPFARGRARDATGVEVARWEWFPRVGGQALGSFCIFRVNVWDELATGLTVGKIVSCQVSQTGTADNNGWFAGFHVNL